MASLFTRAGSALGILLISGAAAAQSLTPSAPPTTPRKPVADEYHGVKVAEDYRWLEDWGDPAVRAWSDAQNQYARSILDNLPGVDAIRARVTELHGIDVPEYSRLAWKGNRLFAMKRQPPKQQPFLVVMESPDQPRTERIVVDPNQIDPAGGASIDFFVPSLDGRLVAVSMSEGGSESGTLHVYETESGRKLEDVVPRVNGGTAGGSVAWNKDATGFYYTRYPREGERPAEDLNFHQQVYFHKLGTPTEADTYELGRDFPRIAMTQLDTHESGDYISAGVAIGDGGEFEQYLRLPDGRWFPVARRENKIVRTFFGSPDQLLMLTRFRAPRGHIWVVPLEEPSLTNVEQMVTMYDASIQDLVHTRENVFISGLQGGVYDLRIFGHRAIPQGFVPILPNSTVRQMLQIGSGELLFQNESFTEPPGWFRVNAEAIQPVKTPLSKSSPVDFADAEVVRDAAVSRDGTRVPITILRPRGVRLDGSNPTILYGYGGYGISITPTFAEIRRLWLEQGGVYAIAHIRGGGEFGGDWHTQGHLTKKQNVFDDFAACMGRIVELGYCTTDKLAIMGGSNGGLLMGAMLTQHPDKFRCTVSTVGIYDMLRVELSPNGQFNVTEFGTVKDKEQFQAMHAYSPYHRVRDGVKYPAVLMMTGANDPRVDPMQSRKMTARLQAADPSGTFLLRTSANAGHGVGSSLNHRVEQDVDRYAFLFHQLGVPYRAPGAGR